MATSKSNRLPLGAIQCDNTTLSLLKANDYVAKGIRDKMKAQGTLVINVTSSAGSGKTSLMQETAKRLKDKIKMAVLVGDLETERDAVRIREAGIPSMQIITNGTCHLEAQMILQAFDHFETEGLDLLFIENVGNLVCPAAFDLGEDYRVTLLASTEGDDKPKKYPRMFLTSEMMLISKSDLLPYIPFNVEAAIKDAREVNPEIETMTVSSTSGEGMDAWCDWLLARIKIKKEETAPIREMA
jgi:hydrogenase nickel incorporation protein HypB